jgi:N12 class adenine-specific DNA methylase
VEKRFSTPEEVLSHWRIETSDDFRLTETKNEALDRVHAVRRRGDNAAEAELVGEALIVAQMHYPWPDTRPDRWGVFHVGTGQPVLWIKPDQNRAEARALAEALDQWRNEAGEPFDWTSDGLLDRLRTPYGRGMIDQARGRDPEARWSGTAPEETETWEADDGREYTYASDFQKVEVYDPDGLLIARGMRRTDANTKKDAFLGEMRDGRRITGERSRHFVQNAVQQHRIAQLEPGDRDTMWIYYAGDRAFVHGTDKSADDWPEMKSLLRSCGFTWSGFAQAYVTAGSTRTIARARGVDRLARALYEQGRMVEIRADEDRLRGINSPATPPPAAAAKTPEAEPAPAAEEAPDETATEPVLAPQDLSDEQLAAEMNRLNEERGRATFGGTRYRRLVELLAPLQQEQDQRTVDQLGGRPDPTGMEDGEITAEREALSEVGRAHRNGPWVGTPAVATARRERDELLRVEQARRTAAELESRAPVAELTDEDLQAEGAQLVRGRHRRPEEAADAFHNRSMVVGAEIADRRLHAWGEQKPVAELDDIELSEAIESLRGLRLSQEDFAGSHPTKDRVERAFEARRKVLEKERGERDEKAFVALLETDGRIRLTNAYHDSGTTRVRIDGRFYGELQKWWPGWRAQIWRERLVKHDEGWRTDALRWLIEQYEQDPETYDTRTWGRIADVELPPSVVDQLTTRFSDLTLSNEAEKYLTRRLAESSRSQSFDERGRKVMVHALDLPQRTLPVLAGMVQRVSDQLEEELEDGDRKTRERAKRARPNVLRALDDLGEMLEAHGLAPVADNASGEEVQQEGETDERVRDEGPPALGDVPAAGAGPDGGAGGVLPAAGDAGAAADRGADRGADGRSDARGGSPGAGGQAERGPADGAGAGAEGDRVPGAGGGEPGRRAAPLVRFRPASQQDLAPPGERAKAAANLEAVRVLKRVQEEEDATAEEQAVMARWSGWGAVPEVFAARPREDDPVFGPGGEREGGYAAAVARWESFAQVRDPLRVLLEDAEWNAAAASTLSAHYTPPEITSALWQALTDLGFDGGEVLEPGSGAGVTFGTAPDSARMTGVEIDPTSAAISRLLAPGVTVLNESFADTVARDGAFDAVVGNVPFARVALYDPKHNRGRHRVHNHFLVKSVALTRPGGVVALITSRHTMDAESDAARAELFENADLLGAVRLPNKAFARSAGTDVVTDILLLRRRGEGEESLDRSWLTSQKQDIDGSRLPVNDYFTAHPEHVLGSLTSRMGTHGPEVAVEGDPDVAAGLQTAMRQITDGAVLARRWYQPHPEGPYRPALKLRPAADLQDFTGRLSADAEGKLWQTGGDGEQVAVELPPKQHAQLTALIELKDLVRGLNELDRSGTDRALADAHRATTKQAYQRYVASYGPLSRPRQQRHVTTQTTDGAATTGLTAWGHFLNDPQAYEVLALEMWEADTETVHASQILDRAPTVRRSVLGQHTEDPQQALEAVLAERGFIDLPHIAWMLQSDEEEARRRLTRARSVFTDPLTGELVYSADYLSGDVRTKLEIARQAARRDSAFATNVAELEHVQPREQLPGQFTISLGAAWLPDDLVQQFFREHLGDAHLQIQHSGNGNWHIRKGRELSEQDEVKHSAGGLRPLALLNRVLNGGAMTGRPPDDEAASRAVRVKADEWRDAFQAWVLNDLQRATRVAEVYNRSMNNRAVRDFTGTRPSLAGLNPDFHPYDHQLASAARMAHERCLVLSHVVGAGKTATMAIGMMAMKNTGQIDKPVVAVPNYLVEQWEDEVGKVFPTARILTLTSADLEDGKRDRVLQYVRANTFDMIIMSHSLFDSLPLSPDFDEIYNDQELRKLDAQILHERRREGKSISLKQLQERRQQHEQDLKAKADAARTPGKVYLDDLGIDFFAIDEAHEYKNLAVRSKIPGARVAGSAKAQHLHAVLEWARHVKPKGPIGCLATGTPLSNAIGELHTLLLLAAPELLRALGIEEFDAFAAMYGKMVERMEMTVDGKGFRSVERFASFHSVESLIRQLWQPVVDFKDAEDLGLELPRTKGGEPELMVVPATADQIQRMEELGERYEAVHQGEVDKTEDNPLSINNDARVIACDPRLIDPEAEPGNKLTALADRIAAKYHETKNNRYTYSTQDQRPHPVPGALQMGFLNQGTPGGKNRGGFNAYQELKDLLAARDVPADKIAFMHDANRADQRMRLTAQANHGGINVLIGSTRRMGKGLNAQNRTVALYHVDPDFRPADMKQKDGRAIRAGNQNAEVEIVWVATANTFDSRMYGTLATKAKGFDALYKARLDSSTDEILEVDDATVPYEEAMAIISGNPYLIEQGELRKQLRRLTLDQNNRGTQRYTVSRKIQRLHTDIDNLRHDIGRRSNTLPSLSPVLGDDFQITLDGVTYTKHKDAAAPLKEALAGVLQSLPEDREHTRHVKLGHLRGLSIESVAYRQKDAGPFVRIILSGLPESLQRFTAEELEDLKGETLLRRWVKAINQAPERQVKDEGDLVTKRATREELLVYYEQLRGQVPGLTRVRERLNLVDALVVAQANVTKAGEPKEGEPSAAIEARKKAAEKRDDLQRQLDHLEAEPQQETTSEAGEVLIELDEGRKPGSLGGLDQMDSEAAHLRASLTVHGDVDSGAVAARIAQLEAGIAQRLSWRKSAETVRPANIKPAEPSGSGAAPGAPVDVSADRVDIGHIGPRGAPEVPTPGAQPPAVDTPPNPSSPAPTREHEDPAPAEAAAPAVEGDGFGTADLYETFGLEQPRRVPAPEPQEDPAPGTEEPAGVTEGQKTVEEAQPDTNPATPTAKTGTKPAAKNDAPVDEPGPQGDPRERMTSADGRLTFTLLRVPEDADPKVREGWQKDRDSFAGVVEAHDEQARQSPQERAEQLAKWRRDLKGDNGLQPFRPMPSLRLTKRKDAPGLVPKDFQLGAWVTWRDQGSGQEVTGQVTSPGPQANTWHISTDRTGHTGEYHILHRSGKRASGYTYSVNGETADLRPAEAPEEQVPLNELPAVDSIPARPVTSYADHMPAGALAPVREPIPVVIGEVDTRPPEVNFTVTADGIPFVVKLDRDDDNGLATYTPRVETEDGTVVANLRPLHTKGAAIEACVTTARAAREDTGGQIQVMNRFYDFDLAEDGVCAPCSSRNDDNTAQPLYRLNGGDPECAAHTAATLRVTEDEVIPLARTRRIWAVRADPGPLEIDSPEDDAARTDRAAGWAITALLREDQVRMLAAAVVVDAPAPNMGLGAVPPDRVRAWIAEQQQAPTAAFYSSASSDLPPDLCGKGDVHLTTGADGLSVEQGEVSTTVRWEELPAWIETAEREQASLVARGALAEALRETTPPTGEQLAASRDRYAPEGLAMQEAAAVVSHGSHEVAREALRGGNRITVVVSGASIQWDGDALGLPVPETATVTGTVYPGHRDYHQDTVLLDAVIRDQTGKEVTTTASVVLRRSPAQAQLIPAEHRDDLRPETRTAGQVRLGDLVAEGGIRGEYVTELHFGNNRRGSVIRFSTRDAAKGTANDFALNFTEEVLIVPRERRAQSDVAVVFDRHVSHHQVVLQTQRIYDLHAAVVEVTARIWPDGTGPQDEIQALTRAIGEIDAAARGVDAYQTNAAAMETAGGAAAALFAATEENLLNNFVGQPLHRLRQHLDTQAQRLHADVAHLLERAAAAPAAETGTTTEPSNNSGPRGADEGQAPPEPEDGSIEDQTEPDEAAHGPAAPEHEAPAAAQPETGASQQPDEPAPAPSETAQQQLGLFGEDSTPASQKTPPDTEPADTTPAADELAQLARVELTGAADIRYWMNGSMRPGEPETMRFHLNRQTRSYSFSQSIFTGTRDECLAWIESEAAVRSAAEALDPGDTDGEQQAAAQAWLREAALEDSAPDSAPAPDPVPEPEPEPEPEHADREERQNAEGPALLPELSITPPEVDQLPQLPDLEPFTEEDNMRDVERLQESFERWSQHPTVEAYHQQDHDARPDGYGDPDNPMAELRLAHRRAMTALQEPTSRTGPEEAVRRIHTVAAWCQALEPAIEAVDLRDLLQDVQAASLHLAARAQATIAALQGLAADNEEETEAAPDRQTPTTGTRESAPERDDEGALLDEAQQQSTALPSEESPNGRSAVDEARSEAGPADPEGTTPVPPGLAIALATPPTSSSDTPEPLQQSEQRFGGPEQLAQYAGRADIVQTRTSTSTVWLAGRLIGYVEDLNRVVGAAHDYSWPAELRRPPGPRFESLPVFGHRDSVSALLEDSQAAVAELVARALQVPVPREAIDADTAWTLKAALGTIRIYPSSAGEDQEAAARLSTLQRVVKNLNAGQLTSIDLADDLALVHDDLLWTADFLGTSEPYLTRAAEELTVFLSGVRPDDSRAWRPDPSAVLTDVEPLAPARARHTRTRAQKGSEQPDVGTEQLGLFGDPAAASTEWNAPKPEPAAGPNHEGPNAEASPAPVDEGATPGSASAAQEGPPERVRGPVVTIGLREGADGALIARVDHGDVARADLVQGVMVTDVPGLHLPTTAEVPVLRRGSQQAEQLVSDEETEQWLAAHLPGSPLAPAWQSDALRPALVDLARDTLRDAMAPAVDDIVEWLLNAAMEQPDLLRAAHTASPEKFRPHFEGVADALVTDGASEHLMWAYLSQDGNGRAQALNLATPRAYEQLRAAPLPPQPEAAPPGRSAAEPAESPASRAGGPQTPEEDTSDHREPVSQDDAEPVADAPEAPAAEDSPGPVPETPDREIPKTTGGEMATPPSAHETDDALPVEEPPEAQPFTDTIRLEADSRYELHLTGWDGQGARGGDLRHEGRPVAAVRLTDSGQWQATLTAEGLRADVTPPASSPQAAAHRAAVMFSALSGTPYGAPPPPAADGELSRDDVLRADTRDVAQRHFEAVTAAAARVSTDYGAPRPQYEHLRDALDHMAQAINHRHNTGRMTGHLTAVREAAVALGRALPQDPGLAERQQLAFPLAHLLYDTTRLHQRIQGTLQAVLSAEQAAAPPRETAVQEPRPAAPAAEAPSEPAREEAPRPTPPAPEPEPETATPPAERPSAAAAADEEAAAAPEATPAPTPTPTPEPAAPQSQQEAAPAPSPQPGLSELREEFQALLAAERARHERQLRAVQEEMHQGMQQRFEEWAGKMDGAFQEVAQGLTAAQKASDAALPAQLEQAVAKTARQAAEQAAEQSAEKAAEKTAKALKATMKTVRDDRAVSDSADGQHIKRMWEGMKTLGRTLKDKVLGPEGYRRWQRFMDRLKVPVLRATQRLAGRAAAQLNALQDRSARHGASALERLQAAARNHEEALPEVPEQEVAERTEPAERAAPAEQEERAEPPGEQPVAAQVAAQLLGIQTGTPPPLPRRPGPATAGPGASQMER